MTSYAEKATSRPGELLMETPQANSRVRRETRAVACQGCTCASESYRVVAGSSAVATQCQWGEKGRQHSRETPQNSWDIHTAAEWSGVRGPGLFPTAYKARPQVWGECLQGEKGP